MTPPAELGELRTRLAELADLHGIGAVLAGDQNTYMPPGGADEEGARLIALNMALNGTPREETEAYLADNFDLEDPQALLDDVYARAGQ